MLFSEMFLVSSVVTFLKEMYFLVKILLELFDFYGRQSVMTGTHNQFQLLVFYSAGHMRPFDSFCHCQITGI